MEEKPFKAPDPPNPNRPKKHPMPDKTKAAGLPKAPPGLEKKKLKFSASSLFKPVAQKTPKTPPFVVPPTSEMPVRYSISMIPFPEELLANITPDWLNMELSEAQYLDFMKNLPKFVDLLEQEKMKKLQKEMEMEERDKAAHLKQRIRQQVAEDLKAMGYKPYKCPCRTVYGMQTLENKKRLEGRPLCWRCFATLRQEWCDKNPGKKPPSELYPEDDQPSYSSDEDEEEEEVEQKPSSRKWHDDTDSDDDDHCPPMAKRARLQDPAKISLSGI